MSPEAEKWDERYGKDVNKHDVVDGKFVPKNRPCDWCGKPVESGYIHPDCAKSEASFFLDLIY